MMSSSQPERSTHAIGGAGTLRDALRYQSRFYRGGRVKPLHGDIQLGAVVFHVRKNLVADSGHDPFHHADFSDEAATFLPVGTPVYEVIGYPADRRLATYLNGTLHIYQPRE
jgi:hypothetical protein